MHKPLALLIIGLFFGAGIGFLVAASTGVTLDGHDHAHNAVASDAKAAHSHGQTIAVPDDANAPTVEVILHPDAMSGWNLEVVTTNFTFSPEAVNQENKPGEGHAHVYVNGEKLARIYAPWMHITSLPAGKTTISVSLNANDHSVLSVGDTPLVANAVVQVP